MSAIYSGLGLGSGSLAAGFAYKRFGPELMFAAAACLMLFAYLVFAISNAIPRKKDRVSVQDPRLAIGERDGKPLGPVVGHGSVQNIALPADHMQSGQLIPPEMMEDHLYNHNSDRYDRSPSDSMTPRSSEDRVGVKGLLDE